MVSPFMVGAWNAEMLLDACRNRMGIAFDSFDRAMASLQEAGPGGNFLLDDLTLDNLRSGEFFGNELFDMSGGNHEGTALLEKAHEKVAELTADFESPLPGSVREELCKYFRDKQPPS